MEHPMSENGTKFICQECFKEYKSLAGHLQIHHLFTWEYLAKHNMGGFMDLTSRKDNYRARTSRFKTKSIKFGKSLDNM